MESPTNNTEIETQKRAEIEAKKKWLINQFYRHVLAWQSGMPEDQKEDVRKWIELFLTIHAIRPNDIIDKKERQMIIHDLAGIAHPDVMKILLDAADGKKYINVPNIFGYTPLYIALMRPAETKKERTERFAMLRLLFENGANPHSLIKSIDSAIYQPTNPDQPLPDPTTYITKDNGDTVMHMAPTLLDTDIIDLFIEFRGNINILNHAGQGPLSFARTIMAINEKQEKIKKKMFSHMLDKGADSFKLDISRNSVFHWLTPDYREIVYRKENKDYQQGTKDQKDVFDLNCSLADLGGFKISHIVKGGLPSDKKIENYKKINTVYDEKKKPLWQRENQDILWWVNFAFVQMGITILGPQLIQKYGNYISKAGLDLRAHFVNEGSRLSMRTSDLSDKDSLTTDLGKLMINKGYGNKDGTGNLEKILKGAYRYKRNQSIINKAVDKRATGLRDVKKYKRLGKRTDVIELEAIIKEPIKINGYWVYESDNSAETVANGEANINCAKDHDKTHMIIIRRQKGKLVPDPNKNERRIPKKNGKYRPGYIIDTELRMVPSEKDPEKTEIQIAPFKKAIGYNNIPAPQHVQDIVMYIEYLMREKGYFGDLRKVYEAREKGNEERNVDYDKATLLIGFNPTGPNAKKDLEAAVKAYNTLLSDTIRDISLLDFSKDMELIVKKYEFMAPEEYAEQQKLRIQ